ESFGAFCGEVAEHVLPADRAAPAAALLLDQLDTALDPFDLESGADRISFELDVAVVGIAPAGGQLLEQAAAEIDRAANVGSPLLEADRDRRGAVVMVMVMVMIVMVMIVMIVVIVVVVVRAGPERDAVLAVVVAERGTQADAVAEPRQAAAERVGFGRAGG